MEHPASYSEIKTGRSRFDEYIKKRWPEFYEHLNSAYPPEYSYQEKVYLFLNGMEKRPVCKVCGAELRFFNNAKGFGVYCSPKCAMNDPENVARQRETCLAKYGSKNNIKKCEETKKERYGDAHYNNADQNRKTCMQRYGVENPMQSEKIKSKSRQTCLERYGSEYVFSSEFFKAKKEEHYSKSKKTCLERYGVENPISAEEIKSKVRQTCLDKYGVEWNCMRKEAHNPRNSSSEPNTRFALLLDANNIQYEKEFPVDGKLYDFKIGNTLIEIDPAATHNINWNPFSHKVHITKSYHMDKTSKGEQHGFRVIHVWDWDDQDKIIQMVKPRKTIYARGCAISEVSKQDADQFLSDNHLQGTCHRQSVIIGLYYKGELIEVMSFGKPRYNKKYEYELLRLCTKNGYSVVGGASRLFKHFISICNPASVISYCDRSKFSGDVYVQLGFKKAKQCKPSCHWYNDKTKKHITNNLLLQKGFDQIFNTSYGKGTSNRDLMLEHGFMEIYDSGQITYTYEKPYS